MPEGRFSSNPIAYRKEGLVSNPTAYRKEGLVSNRIAYRKEGLVSNRIACRKEGLIGNGITPVNCTVPLGRKRRVPAPIMGSFEPLLTQKHWTILMEASRLESWFEH